MCSEKGMTKATYGTGSSIMINIGEEPLIPSTGIVGSIGWILKKNKSYVLEGNINYTGATIKWLVENLGLISDPKESGIIASSVEDSGGVYLVPAFVGLGAPYWDSKARAIIIEELSALGSAFIAGLTVGLWNNLEELKPLREIDRIFIPKMEQEEREKLYEGWKQAVRRSLSKNL
ncbi:MAG: FGGY-family carbohydrate kinase [bacterium]